MEARCLIPFATTAQATDFPFVEQAAKMTRCFDSKKHPAHKIETEYLLCSIAPANLSAVQMLKVDLRHWAVENELHLRLDVTAGEDRSRVRNRVSALNLAMMRRAAVSFAVRWIRSCANPRKATMKGFFDFMAQNHSQKAFSLVTVCHSSWLPPS